jgi:ABC-type transporter Mla MlaB component
MSKPSRLLMLEGSCTLRDSTDMLFDLVALAAAGDPIEVDGGAVRRIDTAGLQLLVAFARGEAAAGRPLTWKAASPELVRCSRQLGLADALGLDTLTAHGSP